MPVRVSASIAKGENRSRTLNRKRLGALPTATGGISRLAYARAQAAGIEMRPLLRKAGLTGQQIRDPNSRVTVDHQIRFLNLAAAALRDEFLGFHLAQSPDLRALGLLYYVPASSETLGEALQRLARYVAMANEGLFLEYHEGRDIKLKLGYVGVSRYSDRHQIEFCLTVLIRLCRQLTGGHLTLARVRVAHHRGGNSSEFAAFFRSEVKFGATADEIAFALALKHLPVV
ncbi:MAG: AraC family transcriptional regulator, partial [Acidobacteria bacterium]|nr:AraC family transcriptional regulator [Acidobacteriota bacterium]